MQIRSTKKSSWRWLAFSAAVLLVGGGYAGIHFYRASMAMLPFDPGYIISDDQMAFANSMNEGQIQSFLKSKNPCNDTDWSKSERYRQRGYQYNTRDGHYVCMADEDFNGESAAHIIYTVAQKYRINPQVLIVLLQKEQGLVTDTWPNSNQYRKATGYGCPDTGNGCDSQYFGLRNQIDHAAKMFRQVLDGGWSNYPVGNNYIQYNPNRSCGGSEVDIKNRATSVLYRYTPYQPNADVLAGRGSSCGAYGNYNFHRYFSEWFGDPRASLIGYLYEDTYNSKKLREILGTPISQDNTDNNDHHWQNFQNGLMYWNRYNGVHVVKGGIGAHYGQLNWQWGALGYPTGDEVYDGRGWWQNYDNGAILGTIKTGFWESKGGIRWRYGQLGWQGGEMGYPTSDEHWDGRGWWQNYENGAILGTLNTGFWESRGSIRARYTQLGLQDGEMGYPTGGEVYDGRGWWQNYENGAIIGTPTTGFWESKGGIRYTYGQLGWQGGQAGYPTGPEVYRGNNTWTQEYEKGTIEFSFANGGRFIPR